MWTVRCVSLAYGSVLWLAGCTESTFGLALPEPLVTTPSDTSSTDATSAPCVPPSGASGVIAVGEVLWPYLWPEAAHRDGRRAALDLAHAACATDPDIDWSPFDVLLFMSFPAW